MDVRKVDLRDARPDEMDAVRGLLREYERGLAVDLCFQDFDGELERLPGDYAGASRGALLVAVRGEEIVGCVALRSHRGATCEMKRLYVRPEVRGDGLGRRLAETIIARAGSLGYERMLLDTLASMQAAQALYRSLGFVETSAYRQNPVPGAAFFELKLRY